MFDSILCLIWLIWVPCVNHIRRDAWSWLHFTLIYNTWCREFIFLSYRIRTRKHSDRKNDEFLLYTIYDSVCCSGHRKTLVYDSRLANWICIKIVCMESGHQHTSVEMKKNQSSDFHFLFERFRLIRKLSHFLTRLFPVR